MNQVLCVVSGIKENCLIMITFAIVWMILFSLVASGCNQ